MATTRRKEPDRPSVELRVPRAQAAAKLQERIAAAPKLPSGFTEGQVDKWDSFNVELLKRLFTTDELAKEYEWSTAASAGVIFGEESEGHRMRRLMNHVAKRIESLDSIKDRLELYPQTSGSMPTTEIDSEVAADNRKVFIVHGHDEAPRDAVARFLLKLELDTVILHEQATEGRTLIEKLEHYGDVGFAVILLTPDDVGAAKSQQSSLRPRARQNVVLELGYFLARLTRARVCPLFKGPLELPSDYGGVGFVEMDAAGGWRLELARELKAAGFPIDLNKAI